MAGSRDHLQERYFIRENSLEIINFFKRLEHTGEHTLYETVPG
jgi:hypothetical protein